MQLPEDQNKIAYHERARVQALKWAMGQPYHNNIDDECCPDFSCCHPDLFEKKSIKTLGNVS